MDTKFTRYAPQLRTRTLPIKSTWTISTISPTRLKTGARRRTSWTYVEYLAQLASSRTSHSTLVITAASPFNAVVNKNSLQNEGLVALNLLVPTLKELLHTLLEQKFDADISLLVLKGTVASHTVEHKGSSLVNNVVLRKVGNDKQLTIHFKKDLTHGIYSYEFDISSDHTSGFDIYMYGECGGSGFRAHTLYRYWASDYLSGKDFNPVKQNNINGGYFQRGSGKKVQFVGSFRYSGDTIVNRGKPYSFNTDTSTSTGDPTSLWCRN